MSGMSGVHLLVGCEGKGGFIENFDHGARVAPPSFRETLNLIQRHSFDEALRRFVQTDPAEVEVPPGKAPKTSKAARKLAPPATRAPEQKPTR
jgi:hypothetical protein